MTLREQMAADVAAIHADTTGAAQSITYTPKGGTATTFRATFIRTGRVPNAEERGQFDVESGQLYVTTSDVATVTLEDSFTVVGPTGATETWNVAQVAFENLAVRELVCVRSTRRKLAGAADLSQTPVGRAER